MSLLFLDGFDHYSIDDISRKWTFTSFSVNAIPTISVGNGRFGGNSFRPTPNGNNVSAICKIFPATSSWVVGFAFKVLTNFTTSAAIVGFYDSGTAQCDLRLNPDNTLSVTRNGTSVTGGTSVTSLTTGVWYYIEWKLTIANSISASSCKVNLNGVNIIDVTTGQDIQNTANSTANQIRLGQVTNSSGASSEFDDVYICDQSGSTNNDFLGDMRIETLYPSGAGNSTQFTPSSGSNYAAVDESDHDDDTTYVESTTVSHKDTYTFSNLTSVPTTIFGLQTVVTARKTDGGIRTMAPVTRSGGTDYDGSTKSLADNYVSDSQIRETDPATATAWSESGVNNAEFGFKIVA